MAYVTSFPDGSVWCNDTTNVNRIFDGRLTYAKGAMILHQLRWTIGDSAFFAALNNYLSDPAFAYKFARTSDLVNHFQISSGQNLAWYFNDWFTGEGFPSYQIVWSQTGSTVNFTVNQTQSHPSVSFFELPIPLKFKNSTQDTILRFNQSFSATIPFAVDSIIFDPDYWIINANNTISNVHELNFTKNELIIFPNPASDNLQVSLTNLKGEAAVEVCDQLGKKVLSQKMNFSAGMNNFSIDIKNLSKGIYYLRILSSDKKIVRKFVKD
jgi:hypothetical protein